MSTTNVTEGNELRIVIGVDGSECAGRALDFAAHEAARWGALLHVVSTYQMPATTGTVVVSLEPFEEAALAVVRAAVARVHELEPGVVVKGEHVFGAAGPVLVHESQGASLLVVGTRGHGGLTSLVMGSVSEYVVHHSCSPVTIVR